MQNKNAATIDEYIANFPAEVQEIMQNIRTIVKDHAPGAEETISYHIPTFRLNGVLLHFAAYDHHIGFYPTPSGIAHLKNELSGYVSGKGSVQFPLKAPIPYDLIARIVAFRVGEQQAKVK